jgi:hypothetical protein
VKRNHIQFPKFSGIRCLMMPYIQGDPDSVPEIYNSYKDIVKSLFLRKGNIGFLTIDESLVQKGKPHRGARAKHSRALHTEAGKYGKEYPWGYKWGKEYNTKLDRDVRVLISNNLDDSCAIWNAEHENTSLDGDIGHFAQDYPYTASHFMKSGEICNIGILTPHESLPVKHDFNRQFIRIVSSGVHGREEYFTRNPILD